MAKLGPQTVSRPPIHLGARCALCAVGALHWARLGLAREQQQQHWPAECSRETCNRPRVRLDTRY